MACDILDSSAWLEVLLGTSRAGLYEPVLKTPDRILVPAVVVYEVHRRLLRDTGTVPAGAAADYLMSFRCEELDSELAREAAELGAARGLAMADSIIYATTLRHHATLWTQDADLEGLPSVRFFRKSSPLPPTPKRKT